MSDVDRDTRDELARELETIRSAIEMVASGHAPRVTLAGIRYGEELLPAAKAAAAAAHVALRPIWNMEDVGASIVVEVADELVTNGSS